jgi:hypothetical protein
MHHDRDERYAAAERSKRDWFSLSETVMPQLTESSAATLNLAHCGRKVI